MDPFTMAGIGAMILGPVISGGISYINGKAGQKDAQKIREQASALFEKIQAPNFSPDQLSFEEFELVGKFNPQVAELILPMAPQLTKGQGADAQLGGNAEREALSGLLGLSRTGSDAILDAQRNQSSRAADADAQAQMNTVDQTMARRGFAPTGAMAYGAAMQGGQDAAMRSAMAGESAAQDAQGRRMEALGQAGTLGGNIRARDVEMENKNVNATNAFNQLIANLQTGQNRYGAEIKNDAQASHLKAAQEIKNANTQGKNGLVVAKQDRADGIEKFKSNFAANKITGQSNALGGQAQQVIQNTQQENQSILGAGQIVSNLGAGVLKERKYDPKTKTYGWRE